MQLLPSNSAVDEPNLLEFIREFDKMGVPAVIVTDDKSLQQRLKYQGQGNVYLLPKARWPWTIWRNAKMLSNTIRKKNVAILHARGRDLTRAAYLCKNSNKVKFVTGYDAYNKQKGLVSSNFAGEIIAKGDPVIVPSKFAKSQIMQRHGLSPSQVAVVYDGVNTNRLNPRTVSEFRVRELADRWHVLNDLRPIFICFLHEPIVSAADHLIDAVARLKSLRSEEDFLCVICNRNGYRESAPQIEKKAKKAGVSSIIRIDKDYTDISAALALGMAAIVVSTAPQYRNEFVLEAQAMGKPVIGADHGVISEIISHEESGWLYRPGDYESLANYMNTALERKPEQIQSMSTASRESVLGSFTQRQVALATLRAYGYDH